MRTSLAAVTTAMLLSVTTLASAQEDECTPGSWFCDEDPANLPADEAPVEEAPAEVAEGEVAEPAPPEAVEAPSEKKSPPPIVVYKPDNEEDPTVILVDRSEQKRKRDREPRWTNDWGLNLHLQGVLMGDDDEYDGEEERGMGGFGLGMRYRPKPHFAFEVGLDFLWGNDYEGSRRNETALLFNGIVFFNPKDKVQVYGLGGFGFSGARVVERYQFENGAVGEEELYYSYFGLQMGLGLEFKIGKHTALNVDMIGFIRGRTDDLADEEYEFVDEDTGRGTNTSGGGLFRGGLTFYW